MSAAEQSGRNVIPADTGVVPGIWQKITKEAIFNPQDSDQVQVEKLNNTWSSISSLAEIPNAVEMFSDNKDKVYRITLFVILSVNWERIRKISKTALIAALETCAKKFDKNCPIAAKKCRILISIINNPWENTLIAFLNSTKQPVKGDTKAPPPTYPVISNQIVEYIAGQPSEVLTTRLTLLIERLHCLDLALNLARVCKKCSKGDSPMDKHTFFDFYVGLLYKFKLVQEFYEEVLDDLTVEDGLILLDRYSNNESLAPNLLKKQGMKKASQTVVSHLVSKVMQSENATNSREDQVFKVAEKWICLNRAWETSDEELQRMLGQFGEVAASTLHMYLLCSAIQAQLGPRSFLSSDMLQQIIRRLNEGHNEVKKHIQDKDNMRQSTVPEVETLLTELKHEVLEAEHRLADEFLLLGELVRDCVAAHRECLLTAFSLRPTPEGLVALEAVAPPPDTKENCGLLSLTGEVIGCSTEVCDDLLIILNSARWPLLKWETEWLELKDICAHYMKDPDGFRYKKQELTNAQVPVYCDYKVVHEDRMLRRIRLKEVEEEDLKKRQMQLRIEFQDDEPSPKKMRTLHDSDSDSSDLSDMELRETFVVGSCSDSDCTPESQQLLTLKQSPPQSPSRDVNGDYAPPTNKVIIEQLKMLKHNGSPTKVSAPSLYHSNIQPRVLIKNDYRNVPGMTSYEYARPTPIVYNVQVLQVGPGVAPSQPNSTPVVSQQAPEPPPTGPSPSNGAAQNSGSSEQLPKFQQVFGKSFQNQQPQQSQAAAQQPTALPSPSQSPQQQTPPPQHQQQQQQTPVTQTTTVVQQPTRVLTNQASLLRTATPIQITQSSLEALIQAHPQLASALAGREGKIMCFKQGSNIILTDKIRPDCQPGTSGLKRPVKRPPEAAPTPTNSQLENELREFDAVLRSVKERDGSNNTTPIITTPTTPSVVVSTPVSTPTTPVTSTSFSQPPPLTFNKSPTSSGVVSTPSPKPPAKKQAPVKSNNGAATSPNSSVSTSPGSSSSASSTPGSTLKPSAPSKAPPKASVEDEQTQKRIYEILSEYTEQLRNSPDLNNKPAPRRRSNPPTNPSPKRKKKPKESDEHLPSEDSSSNLAQDSEEHDSISESGSSLPAESPPAVVTAEPPPQPAPTVIAIPVSTPSKPLVLQRQLMVVGKGASQKLFRVIPANNSNLRALTAAPTLLLHQMCKPEQLVNLQSVRSVKIPVMSSQQLTGVSVQQPLVVPFQSQMVKKEQLDNQSLIESLLQAAEIKQEPIEQIKVEPIEEEEDEEEEEEEEEASSAQSASDSPVPEVKNSAPRGAKMMVKSVAVDKKRRLVRQDNIQKSLSEECEDLGVDAPSTSELFPDADLPFELSNNSDSSLSYLDACQQQQRRRNNGTTSSSELPNGRSGGGSGAEDSGADSPKRRKVCLTRPFAALKSRRDDEAADTDGSVDGDDAAKAKRAVKPRSSCACCGPAAAPKTPAASSAAAAGTAKKLNGKAGKKK